MSDINFEASVKRIYPRAWCYQSPYTNTCDVWSGEYWDCNRQLLSGHRPVRHMTPADAWEHAAKMIEQEMSEGAISRPHFRIRIFRTPIYCTVQAIGCCVE